MSWPLQSIVESTSGEALPAEACLEDDACTDTVQTWLFTLGAHQCCQAPLA